MIYDLGALNFKIGLHAEEHEGIVRIHCSLYDLQTYIYKQDHQASLLETNYVDANPNLHSKKQLRKVIKNTFRVLVGRRVAYHEWLDGGKKLNKRVDALIQGTVLEEKIKQERFLSKFS